MLRCLLQRKGRVVSKQDILQEVWPGLHVTEDLVREYVFDLRAAFGDDARNPSYIETVRGKGFRLSGAVEFADTPAAASVSGAKQTRPTIAVLRPIIQGTDPALAEIAEGLADAIIAAMANNGSITVVSRHSSFAIDLAGDLRDAAANLGAGYLLESSLKMSGNQRRATYYLVDGQSGRHVWAQRFGVPDNGHDGFEQLASQVVNALAGWHGELHVAAFKLISRKRSDQLTAFEHFICGCDLELNFDAVSVTRALDHLDKSLALDPGFARCWVVKAIMLQWAYDVFAEKNPDILAKSAQAMDKAYLLNPRDPLTLSLIALQRARRGDLTGALDAVDRAEATCKSDADACVCVATALCVLAGRFDSARKLFDLAIATHPVPPGWYRFVEARISFFFGEYERSIAASKSGPQRVSAVIYRCLSQVMLGQIEAAVITYENLLERYPGFDFDFYAGYFPIADPAARQHYDTAVAALLAGLDKDRATKRLTPS